MDILTKLQSYWQRLAGESSSWSRKKRRFGKTRRRRLLLRIISRSKKSRKMKLVRHQEDNGEDKKLVEEPSCSLTKLNIGIGLLVDFPGELEADWLSEVGLGEWTQQWRQGKSLPENDIGPAVQKLSLKPHQADALRRRIQTLNATLKKRRKMRRPPDIRGFFQSDISENKVKIEFWNFNKLFI